MAALLLAEDHISVEQLKPWWRLWGFPTPSFKGNGKSFEAKHQDANGSGRGSV